MCVTYVILLSFLGLVIHSQAQNCTVPVAGEHMKLKDNFSGSQTFQNGDKVSFDCDLGYIPAGGSSSITCTAGSWSPLRMTCERRNCGSAEDVANGKIDYSEGTEFGDKIVVTCNSGYNLVGKNTIFCGVQGWMDRLPVCEVVVCFPPLSSAAVTFSPIKETYDFGDVVQYNCPKDYTLSGSKSLSCSEDGTFKPAPPTCVNVQCEEPNIDNANWVDGSRPPHKYKSTVSYACVSGYTMTGARTQTCELDGQWSPGLPTCQPVQCEDPKIPNADRVDGSQPPYKYKSTVTFKCISGYTMTGARTQTCETDGQWSPGPTCKPVQCEDPKIPNADRVDGSQPPYKYKSTVTFKCISGFTMTGARTQTCETDGQWSPGPTCKLHPGSTDPPPPGNDGNAKAIGWGVGLTVTVLLVQHYWL